MPSAISLGALDLVAVGAATRQIGGGDVEQASMVIIQIVGAFTATITVQGSLDGSTWVSLLARPVGSTTAASTITVPGLYQIEASGVAEVRLSWPGTGVGAPTLFYRAVVG